MMVTVGRCSFFTSFANIQRIINIIIKLPTHPMFMVRAINIIRHDPVILPIFINATVRYIQRYHRVVSNNSITILFMKVIRILLLKIVNQSMENKHQQNTMGI